MASQYYNGKKEEWKVASMCGLHKFEQGLSKRTLFPMPRIDQLVDAIVGHPQISFLDVFQGYHQIPLALGDQEKIVFVTPTGNYHYKVMPFGLKNARSTY